jgi:hypothetical protein
MTSLTANLTANFTGYAEGRTSFTDLNTVMRAALAANLSSTSSGATIADDALFYADRTLAAGASETFDLRSFTDALAETGAIMSKVRIYLVSHPSASAASSITVGGAAANQFVSHIDGAASTFTIPKGGFLLMAANTTAGMTVDATHKDLKVLNNDGSNAATYTIAVIGE